MAEEARRSGEAPRIQDFLDEPNRDLSAWRWLWEGDHAFPIRSHRGVWGRLLVWFKCLLRPLVKVPQNDLWERQRAFNLVALGYLEQLADIDRRVTVLETFLKEGIREVMRHNDALFARVDQKLDRHAREVRDLTASLGEALARLEGAVPEGEGSSSSGSLAAATEVLEQTWREHGYFELERRFRGTEEEIGERLARYLPYLQEASQGGDVLDLGCGRGESLALLAQACIPARGVDSSARMVAHCREQGLRADEGDLFESLEREDEGSLGAVVSFHVIEHLPSAVLDRLVRLAHRALAPGGILVLETPNPLSLMVSARSFWLDPTHRRPIHPESLRLLYELAGFSSVEVLELRPFPARERLPEVDLEGLSAEAQLLADRTNRLRDRLDELLFGYQDFAVVGKR